LQLFWKDYLKQNDKEKKLHSIYIQFNRYYFVIN